MSKQLTKANVRVGMVVKRLIDRQGNNMVKGKLYTISKVVNGMIQVRGEETEKYQMYNFEIVSSGSISHLPEYL